jgi:hypothetical protein
VREERGGERGEGDTRIGGGGGGERGETERGEGEKKYQRVSQTRHVQSSEPVIKMEPSLLRARAVAVVLCS